jgi:hypothetical protein
MRPVAFGEALSAGTRLTLFSDDKPDRFFTVIKFCMDKTSGVALEVNTGVPPTRSKTACRAEGLPEAGGRQDAFTDSRVDRGRERRPMVPLAAGSRRV